MKRYVAFLLLAVAQLTAEPRPVGDAERDAVAIVAGYLSQGPEAVWNALASDAPLRSAPKEDALREIAARMGPRDDATWTLQTIDGHSDAAFRVRWPSGYEDGLLFRMRRAGDTWVLHELLTLAETSGAEELPPGTTAATDATATPGAPRIPWPLIAVSVVLILIGLGFTRYRLLSVALVAIGLALGASTAYQHYRLRNAPAVLQFAEVRALESFRAALARGADAKIPSGLSERTKDIGTLWLLQSGAAIDIAGTRSDPIAGLATVVRTPLAELVRARVALNNMNEADAVRAFGRAAALPPMREDILQEAAASLDEEGRSSFVALLRNLGSRDAETYYRSGTYDDFRTAWMLDPKPREELVRDAALFDLLSKDFRVKPLVSFYSATEPARRSQALGTRALTWPAEAKPLVCGERLRVEIGKAALEVPNGASLAPANAQVVPATYGEQRRDAAALRDAQELLEKRLTTAPRTRVVRAVRALARHNRWNDVLELTEKATAAELVFLRLRALLRNRRVDEARTLATQKLEDPGAIVAIAEALSTAGEWDTAEQLFNSVKDEKQQDVIAARLQQLQARRTLATSSQVVATEHFDIRHDATINPAVASRIGDLLEAELARLRQKLPPVQLRRVAVNVLRWDDFRTGITFSDHILGLYDGEILFPFAAVAQFKPEVVSVITHELMHAVLAQATNDNAPRWFQEGVATRVELVPRQENVFRDTQPGLVLPVALLDATMERNADPSAYVVAQTFIRFLEDQYGDRTIATLAAEFARGTTSDDALVKVAGKSLDAINADFRQWGFHHNGDFTMTEKWPYGEWYSLDVDPRIKAGFKFGDP